MKAKELQVGDWFKVNNGVWDNTLFYIEEIKDGIYLINSPSFLTDDDPNIVTEGQLNYGGITLLGKSKPNPWYKFFGWTSLVHPVRMEPL